jgi:hypothetical protein
MHVCPKALLTQTLAQTKKPSSDPGSNKLQTVLQQKRSHNKVLLTTVNSADVELPLPCTSAGRESPKEEASHGPNSPGSNQPAWSRARLALLPVCGRVFPDYSQFKTERKKQSN